MGNAVLPTIHIKAKDPVSLADLKLFMSRKQTNPTFSTGYLSAFDFIALWLDRDPRFISKRISTLIP